MTWKGYTITARDEFGATQDSRTVMNRHEAGRVAAELRIEGFLVSVWPPLPPDIRADVVALIKSKLSE